MEECFEWFCYLAQDLVAHEQQPGFDAQQALGALVENDHQEAVRIARREALVKARSELIRARILAGKRDHGSIAWGDMDPAAQGLVEDFDTGRLEKQHEGHRAKRLRTFRSSC